MSEKSFMKALFHGVIAEDVVLPYPKMRSEESETLDLVLDNLRKFLTAKVDPAKIDAEHTIPQEVLDGMKELGLFGLTIPESHGGLGLSNTAYARIMQEVGSHDASLAVTVGAHQSIGMKALLLFGTDAQKAKYLERLASGEMAAAFALTEPEAGSDAANIRTQARVADNGEGYILNGSKIWITNGGFADFFTVFARTTSPDESKPKITAFIVERGQGVKSGPSEEKMGIRGSSTVTLYFDDVFVPKENVLGEVGRGFKVAMEVLNNGRLGLSAGCLGGSKTMLDLALARVTERKAFGKNIGDFGMIQEKIARMSCETYALEAMTYLTTGLIDAGVKDFSLESAICKVFGSETYWMVANETLQIAAGIGYMTEYPYERMLRDSRINLIFEGTNEILRAFIALSGMQGPGTELKEVVRALREPIKGFGVWSEFAVRRARTALGRERLTQVHPALGKEAVIFDEAVADLTREVERALRKHGKRIMDAQFIQKRIAEVAIDLYALIATLSRATSALNELGEQGAQRDLELAQGFAVVAQQRLQARLGRMERDDDELLKEVARSAIKRGTFSTLF